MDFVQDNPDQPVPEESKLYNDSYFFLMVLTLLCSIQKLE